MARGMGVIRSTQILNGLRITVDIVGGLPALTIYDHAGQLPRALERPVVERARAVLGDQLPVARIIVRFCGTIDCTQTRRVQLVVAAIRQALATQPPAPA